MEVPRSVDPVRVVFEGRPLACRAGTSVAVALWERGVRVLSHSPKYGRPRGLHCARGHCTSCLVRIDGVPNVRACLTPVREGMRIERQGAGAAYGRPLQRLLGLADPLFPVGFYFKWFTRPGPLRRLFLRGLRPLTGIGRLPDPDAGTGAAGGPAAATAGGAVREEPAAAGPPDAAAAPAGDPERFDAVVVGAGLWGLREAARLPGRTLLVDDHPEPGGQRRAALEATAAALGDDLGGLPLLARARRELAAAVATLGDGPAARGLGWRAVAAYRPDLLLVHDGRRLRGLRAGTVVWAAGALDRIGLFPGNDLPGLLGPRGLYRAVARDGLDVRGLRAVVCGGGLDLWLAAALLEARGTAVTVAPVDGRRPRETAAAAARGWQLHVGLEPVAAAPLAGDRLRLALAPAGGAGRGRGGAPVRLDCDLAVVCGRGKPAYDLPYQLGCDLELQPARGGYLPRGAAATGAGPAAAWEADLAGGPRLRIGGEALGLLPEELVGEGDEAGAGEPEVPAP